MVYPKNRKNLRNARNPSLNQLFFVFSFRLISNIFSSLNYLGLRAVPLRPIIEISTELLLPCCMAHHC